MLNHSQLLEILRAEFPRLQLRLEQHAAIDYPETLVMMEFHLFMREAVTNDDWPLVAQCLSVLNKIFEEGDPATRNAVYVSFLENIDLSDQSAHRLKELMSPTLQRAHGQIDQYMMQSGIRKKSYRPT